MYNSKQIEKKWQSEWEKARVFQVQNKGKKKFYCLEMFPYPSGYGLHMGHARNYAIGDAYARFKRMHGFNVLYPMGYDAFGLPAENAAIKNKSHPKKFTEDAIRVIKEQQKQLGLSYDWSRLFATCYSDYYKWNQFFFLKFLEKGLAYRKKAPINWCPGCETVLANEQVEQGKCWRCHSKVSVKQLEQWFFKITDYAEVLLAGLKKLEGWPEKIKTMQENWIGKSLGTLVNFRLKGSKEAIQVFTTRLDTLCGATFVVYAPEHPKVLELIKDTKYEKPVKEFVDKVILEERFSRIAVEQEKEGMFIGKYAINPVTNEEIPVYIANFVLPEYGTGIIMAVPAHDQRDFEFAKKYGLPIKVVIMPKERKTETSKISEAYIGDGILVNSNKFNGIDNKIAIQRISQYLEKQKLGKKTVQYKLRDWLISRQRYWGTPIPIIYCDKCGIVPVPIKELPVLLPEDIVFTGHGNPLVACREFVNTKCPKCKQPARRETDTMDTFVDSSWYFLRYCLLTKDAPFDKKAVGYWMPVDQYIGGAEHAVMHLLYARFFTKVLRDLGFINFNEPFTRLFNQGMVIKDGQKMSKSYGNIVSQEEIAEKYGIDTARFFLLSIASPDKELEWSDEGAAGAFRALNKIYNLFIEKTIVKSHTNKKDENKMHKTIREATNFIDGFKYNLAIISIMNYVDYLARKKDVNKECASVLIRLISPFTPHLAEELWHNIGNKTFVSLEKWPEFDSKKIDARIDYTEEITVQLYSDIKAIINLINITPKQITLFIAPDWKFNLFRNIKKKIGILGRNQKEFFQALIKLKEFKQHAPEIIRLLPAIIKEPKRIPAIILSQKEEFKIIKEEKNSLEKELVAEIMIMPFETASQQDHQKAKQAMPGKPAILLK